MQRATSRLLLVLAAAAGSASAQSLVRDISVDPPPAPGSSSPRDFVELGGLAFFTSEFPDVGRELAVSDGTSVGTMLVLDLFPGLPSSAPEDLMTFGGALYFTAETPDHGRELWRSDGTAAGTQLVVDLFPGPQSSFIRDLTPFQGELYFGGGSFVSTQLWKTDGTSAGTVLVDAGTPPTPAATQGLKVLGSDLFFTTRTTASGFELWKTAGVPGDAVLVKDIAPGSASSFPLGLTEHAGVLYFTAAPAGDRELWLTDGTAAGTRHALDPSLGSDYRPRILASFGPYLYFTARFNGIDDDLWRTDGTVAGTTLVRTFPTGGITSPTSVAELAGQLYFSASEGGTGNELWRTDGTTAGTQMVVELYPGFLGSNPTYIHEHLGQLVFAARDGSGLYNLWESDGTAGGTAIFSSFASPSSTGIAFVSEIGGELWSSSSSPELGAEPWRTGSTGGSSSLVKDVVPTETTVDAEIRDLHALHGKLVFVAETGDEGEEPWTSDASTGETELLLDVQPGPSGSFPQEFVEFQDRLHFTAAGASGVWRTDGTTGGTELLSHPTQTLTSVNDLTATPVGLLFEARTTSTGIEPWILRPGHDEPGLLRDLNPGSAWSSPRSFHVLGSEVVFVTLIQGSGYGLWKTDGTEAGTVELDFDPGVPVTDVAVLASFDGRLYFAVRSANVFELWATDGTSAGTVAVPGLTPNGLDGFPTLATVAGGRLVFDGGANGVLATSKLYSTDGTTAGSELLHPAADPGSFEPLGELVFFTSSTGRVLQVTDGTLPGTAVLSGSPAVPVRHADLQPAGPRLYFSRTNADSSVSNPQPVTASAELWSTDGTLGGTMLVADVDPNDVLGDSSLTLRELSAPGSGPEYLFVGNDYTHGAELWLTDGSAGSETRLADIAPGLGDSAPSDLVRVADRLYFVADDGDLGRELYSMPFSLTGGYVVETFGAGCPGTGGLVPRMTASPVARLGQPLTIGIEDAPPASRAYLYFSPQRQVNDAAGCTFYLGSPLFFIRSIPTDGSGAGAWTSPAITDPTLLATPLHFQFFVLDPAGPVFAAGTFSDALEVLFGP